MKKLAAIIWASMHIDEIDKETYEKRNGKHIPIALFGGAGFRLHCPTLNKKESPLYRSIKDVDILLLKKDGYDFTNLLCNMHKKLGEIFFHTTTYSDKRFNLLRGGDRYRFTTISEVGNDGVPIPGILEIFADKLTFCHNFLLTREIEEAAENYFTIGLENLILLKAQFIKKIPKSELPPEYAYRVLGEYDRKNIVIGMEDKDMRDIAGALLDHEIGKGSDRLDIDRLGMKLLRDWALWKTFTMNLESMHRNFERIMKNFGVNQKHAETIRERLDIILEAVNTTYRAKKPFFSFASKQWWQTVEEQVR